jgi:uncharacterized phage-associated protein
MNISQRKAANAIVFFLLKSPKNKMGRLKLMKLLWLADRIHLNNYGRMILRDNYYALPFGPAPTQTLNMSNGPLDGFFTLVGKYTLAATGEFNPSYFSKSDIEVLNLVWDKYGGLDDIRLKDVSHNFKEWLRYQKDLEDKEKPNSYPMIMDDFFTPPVGAVDYDFDNDRCGISREHFMSHSAIVSALTD